MISVKLNAKDIMNADAQKAYPHECCGFFFGVEEPSGDRVVTHAVEVDNSSEENKQRRFVISPRDYLKAEQFAAVNDLALLGVYHSHPDHPAIPSEHDRVAAQPWFSYVIISTGKDGVRDTRSWRLNESGYFEEEHFEAEASSANK